jgi:hypothetical protein
MDSLRHLTNIDNHALDAPAKSRSKADRLLQANAGTIGQAVGDFLLQDAIHQKMVRANLRAYDCFSVRN